MKHLDYMYGPGFYWKVKILKMTLQQSALLQVLRGFHIVVWTHREEEQKTPKLFTPCFPRLLWVCSLRSISVFILLSMFRVFLIHIKAISIHFRPSELILGYLLAYYITRRLGGPLWLGGWFTMQNVKSLRHLVLNRKCKVGLSHLLYFYETMLMRAVRMNQTEGYGIVTLVL